MFKIHLHLMFLCLVLSFKNIESRNILKKFKPLYEPSGAKAVKTGMVTTWLRQKTMKFILLSSFILLAKEGIFKKPKSVTYGRKINIPAYPNVQIPYPRIGWWKYWMMKNKCSHISTKKRVNYFLLQHLACSLYSSHRHLIKHISLSSGFNNKQ